jgi:membrane fusion protein (multidrug efflux system)
MPVEFEKNYLRKSHRMRLPARVAVKGKVYEVADWSFTGFRILITAENNFKAGEHVLIAFILPFTCFDLRFSTEAELKYIGPEDMGFEFLDLSAEARMLMREYVEAHIEGRLDGMEGIIKTVEAEVVPPITEQRLSRLEQSRLDRKLKIRSTVYGALGLLLAAVIIGVVYQQRYVYSVHGHLTGNTVELTAKVPGVIKTIKVAADSKVTAGELLMQLEDREYVDRVNELRELQRQRQKVVDATTALIEEEKRRLSVYKTVAEQRTKIVDKRLDEVRAELDLARIDLDRTKQLFEQEVYSRAKLDEKQSNHDRLYAMYLKTQEELALSGIVKEESRDGRFFSGYEMQGRLADLELLAEERKALLQSVTVQLLEAQESLRKTRVLGPQSGVVYTVVRIEGDHVNAGDTLMTLETGAKPWVLGRFVFSDAARIKPGAKAQVWLESPKTVLTGTVEAIGHSWLARGGTRSSDIELSLNEVPVKIGLDSVPQGLKSGTRTEVRIAVGFRLPWLPRLVWNDGFTPQNDR